jgi:hypothetical protein
MSNRLGRNSNRALSLSASWFSGLPLASILGGKPHYVHFGWFVISVANLVVIGLMIVVFVLAIVLPFPGHRGKK